MDAPLIDMTHEQAVYQELLDDDKSVKERFVDHFSAELRELSGKFAKAFRHLPALNEAANKDGRMQAALVAAFAFCTLDDVLVSTKVLLTGKLMPSGNLMRQAVEGIAVAILCAYDGLLIVDTKRASGVPECYWRLVEANDKRAQGFLALRQLEFNKLALRIDHATVDKLIATKDHYNRFSHPNMFSFASRAALGKDGAVYVGGHFDDEKVDGYRSELRERIGLVSILPNLLDGLSQRITAYRP